MNIEANLKKLKTSIKRRKKITLTLMLGFLMTGVIGYAEEPTVESLQKEITKLKGTIEEQNKKLEEQDKKLEKAFKSDKVEIGKGAYVNNAGGTSSNPKGAIAIGENATVHNYIDQSGGIAIGQNAYAESMVGQQEKYFAFNKDIKYNKKFIFEGNTPENEYNHLMTTLVIGNNTYARSGGIMIGPHNFNGKMGDIENISTDKKEDKAKLGVGVLATTLGTNSFTNGAFASTTGAYSIITSRYDGQDSNKKYVSQNFGAVINGSLNSIESYKSDSKFSGIANSIVGVANRANNSNGSLIFGAGNEITNSVEEINFSPKKFESPNDLSEELRKAVNKNKAGGATLAIGGANKADYTKQVSMIGTRNEVKGTKDKKTELVSLRGDNNLVENSRNTVDGNNFHVTGEGNILQGFNKDGSNRNEVKNNNVVALGNDIEVSTDDSVYLGKESANSKKENTLWKADKKFDAKYNEYAGFNNIGGIVSVGNDTLTRVIQNVAPGLISPTSTDAINGSQLYNYVAKQYITIKDGKGGETKVKLGDTITLKGTTVDVTVKKAPDKTTSTTPAPTPTPTTPQPANDKPAEHTVTYETDTFEYKLRDEKTHKDTTLIEGADGKLYTQDFLDKNEYKNGKWVEKKSQKEIEESVVTSNQHNKIDKNVVLSTKYNKIISGVADGTEKNDAVNFGQLKKLEEKVDKNTTDIQQLQKDVKEVEKKSDLALGGVANAVAMANLVQVNSYSDYRHNLSAAYGYYGGSHALAIGFSGVTKDRRLVYKLSGSVNNKGNLAFGVGAGVMLGNKEESMEHKDINVKELYEKMSKLEKENQEFREMFKKLGVMK